MSPFTFIDVAGDLPSLWFGRQAVAGAAPASAFVHQHALGQQVGHVAAGRVLRTMGHARPLGRGEPALEAVEQPREQLPLSFAEGHLLVALPEPRLGQHLVQGRPSYSNKGAKLL